MLRTTLAALAAFAALGITAPIAAADELINSDIASVAEVVAPAAPRFCGGGTTRCAPYPTPPSGFKNGLHGSSQDMLDRVNAKKYGRLT